MLVLAGLGNPGAKYEHQRHNIGFMAVDAIARRWSASPERSKFASAVADVTVAGEKLVLLKPQTYMNDSGRAVAEALKFYKLEPMDLVVFHDELELAPGRFRMKAGVVGDLRWFLSSIGIVPQRAWIECSAVRIELLVLPGQQRL